MFIDAMRDPQQEEAQKWNIQMQRASDAFDFWNNFLILRCGSNNDQPIDPLSRSCFLLIIRAVSWVESRHGTGIGQEPARDPMQCGNPQDSWWEELTGPADSQGQDRFVSGPGGANYYASELPGAVEILPAFPVSARLSQMQNPKVGHDDPGFSADTSFYYGIPFLIQKINTDDSIPNGKTYKCGNVSRERLVNGAVGYNGGGNPDYRNQINSTIDMIGWPSQSKYARRKQRNSSKKTSKIRKLRSNGGTNKKRANLKKR
ncbi:MAG TPA: hypothetical protein VME24_02405 [Alphaproteobacteria bacterium]|nr:hypothetical protein [Alphaproteobacteria bacterium]